VRIGRTAAKRQEIERIGPSSTARFMPGPVYRADEYTGAALVST
jgi:hypothetical protein